jgi:transcription termination factor Rho
MKNKKKLQNRGFSVIIKAEQSSAYAGGVRMKKREHLKGKKSSYISREPIKHIMMNEGKFLHGTRGKPQRGPRGNKKYS